MARLEHVNLTVRDAETFAEKLGALFGWTVRWSGDAMGGAGRSVHVDEAGEGAGYVALYAPKAPLADPPDSYGTARGLNHLGVVVDDIGAAEAAARAEGYAPHNHGDYEPGRRFYFDGPEGVEIEVVAYDA